MKFQIQLEINRRSGSVEYSLNREILYKNWRGKIVGTIWEPIGIFNSEAGAKQYAFKYSKYPKEFDIK